MINGGYIVISNWSHGHHIIYDSIKGASFHLKMIMRPRSLEAQVDICICVGQYSNRFKEYLSLHKQCHYQTQNANVSNEQTLYIHLYNYVIYMYTYNMYIIVCIYIHIFIYMYKVVSIFYTLTSCTYRYIYIYTVKNAFKYI